MHCCYNLVLSDQCRTHGFLQPHEDVRTGKDALEGGYEVNYYVQTVTITFVDLQLYSRLPSDK